MFSQNAFFIQNKFVEYFSTPAGTVMPQHSVAFGKKWYDRNSEQVVNAIQLTSLYDVGWSSQSLMAFLPNLCLCLSTFSCWTTAFYFLKPWQPDCHRTTLIHNECEDSWFGLVGLSVITGSYTPKQMQITLNSWWVNVSAARIKLGASAARPGHTQDKMFFQLYESAMSICCWVFTKWLWSALALMPLHHHSALSPQMGSSPKSLDLEVSALLIRPLSRWAFWHVQGEHSNRGSMF